MYQQYVQLEASHGAEAQQRSAVAPGLWSRRSRPIAASAKGPRRGETLQSTATPFNARGVQSDKNTTGWSVDS